MSERHTESHVSDKGFGRPDLTGCVLRVVEGPDRGRLVPLGAASLLVGAAPECDLALSDPTVSAVHAEFALLPGGVRVRDRASRNGVRYLDNRIDSAVLQPGSVVRLGRTLIAIQLAEGCEQLSEARAYGSLISHSAPMRRVVALLEQLEGKRVTVLITGETGTGKSLVAEILHERSGVGGPFVTLDCGAVAPDLLQSELFGHVRGAFTGAHADRPGAFQQAHRGTLFLDEVGELPLELQPSLLRVIETGELRPVGGSRTMTVDVRVIAATNRRLDDAVEKGGFRRDLYHRLDVLRIAMPPLRECPEDVVPLVERFLALGNPSLAVPALTPDLIATLRSYPWPGNVRQLRNAAERIAAIGSIWDERRVIDRAAGEKLDFHQAKARLLESFERVYLTELLREHAGNLTRAAAACGLMRHHLRNLLRKYGIDPRGFRTRS